MADAHQTRWFRSDLLHGRAALITGGGTGIGRGIALAFAAHGCDIAVLSRSVEHLEPTAAAITQRGVRGVAVAADVRHPAALETAIGDAVGALGRLDVVVNGAAGNFACLAESMSPNGFGTVIDIDLKGTFNVSRLAFPYLRSRGGCIVNISTTLQYLGTIGQVHASAAKAGIDAMTRTLAVEWGPYNIRVNAIAPGPTDDTEGVRRLTSDERRAHVIERTPLRRLASIDDVANAALFLCSDAAGFINGATLVMDGGLWLHSNRVMSHPLGSQVSPEAAVLGGLPGEGPRHE